MKFVRFEDARREEMTLAQMMEKIKSHPDFHKAGMVLCHNGVVRETSRDGRRVTGLRVAVDEKRLGEVLDEKRKIPGIVDILVHIDKDKDLGVGDDVMYLIVAGDVRENVIGVLRETLDAIKSTVTRKTEFFWEKI
jgi:molybdopterin synthase catalytic subunit